MPIQFACSCGEPLCFADDQSGAAAACPRCGAALTVPRVGLFVEAGDKLPPPVARLPAASKPVPVAAPFAPPPGNSVASPPRRRPFPWLAAVVLLLVAGGSLPMLFPKTTPPPKEPGQLLPAHEEGGVSLPLVARTERAHEEQPPEKEVAVSPIDPPRRPVEQEEEPPAVDPVQLQRLRADKDVTGPLVRDLRRELRLLRNEQAERRAEAQEVRRQLDRLRAEMSAEAVRSVEESVAGEPGVTPFDRLAARGRDALTERDYEVAVRELTRAAALDPDNADVRALLDTARAAQDKVNKEVPEALDRAKEALFRGDVEDAKNIYAVLLLTAPKDKRVREAVGRLQTRMAKGEISTDGSRWLTVEEIEGRHDSPARRPHDWWSLGGANPEITARAIAYGRVYRSSIEEQTTRGQAGGLERDAALRGETDRADRAGRDHDAGLDAEGRRIGSAWAEGMMGLAEGTARSDQAGHDAQIARQEQDARLARVSQELEGVWRQQGQRAHDGAAGQMLGLLQQHGRIAEAVRRHDALLWEQGGRMAGGGGGAWVEQDERAGRARRDLDAGLRMLIGRAEEAGRRFDAGLRAQNDRSRTQRPTEGAEVGDRFRNGAHTGRENMTGQEPRFNGGRPDPEIDERARDAAGRMTARELEDRIRWGTRDQRIAMETRHNSEVHPHAEPDAPPPPPRVEDPAAKEKERDDAERALEERNRKARETAELRKLTAEREQRQHDLDELKKLVAEKEAQQRDLDELKLLRAEQERLRRLRDGFKGIAQEPKKE